MEERIERAIRFPDTLRERERDDLASLMASSRYARDLATFFEEFYAELARLAIPPQNAKSPAFEPNMEEARSDIVTQAGAEDSGSR